MVGLAFWVASKENIVQEFALKPFLNQWFAWSRINECFWPGAGKRSEKIDAALSPVRNLSGIYVIAWGSDLDAPNPAEDHVQYIGMTDNFKRRMAQFASSAGIHYDGRYDGHSAAWRWPEAKFEKMKISFFPLLSVMEPHMKSGFLYWQEALAIDCYFKAHGKVPPLNAGGGEIKLDE